ncbi:MAG TPA: acyl-CoA dehydrogenase, partial [Acidimicrobiia bacterium]|nr:acyl-CoA dehydrogenase [Acidimicrobiia bacterium]
MPSSDLSQFRRQLAAWLDEHRHELVLADRPDGLDGDVAQMRHAIGRLHDAGWMRYGWPEAVGGLGG